MNGTGPWTQWLRIAHAEPGGGWRVQLFNGAATFPTRAAAVAACVQLGRDIIDGKVSDRAVLFQEWARSPDRAPLPLVVPPVAQRPVCA